MTRRLVLLLSGTLVALAMAEAATRILVPDPYLAFENRIELFIEDEHAGYRNRPNYQGFAQGTIRVRTDGLGFRGPGPAPHSSPGVRRVLVLGDSITWGVGVQEEDSYPHVLQHAVRSGTTPESPVEIQNAGVIGYSLHQELLLLEHRGLALAPDIVVVGFALNDAYPTEDPFFNIQHFHRPSRDDVRRRTYEPMPKPASYLYRWLRSLARRAREQREAAPAGPAGGPPVWAPGSFEVRAWPVLQTHFSRMVELAKREDFRLMVLVFPTAGQLDADSSAPVPQALLREFFDASGLAYIDLFETLRPAGAGAFLDNMHLTPEGHRIVANRLLAELHTRGWLQP